MSSSIPASIPGKPWQPLSPEELQPELPQYAVLSLLGRGGMGAVYKAVQKSLGREVAIKVLPPTIDDGGMRFAERFLAEANAQARLNHPNIVSVYDAGETPGGLLYMVMEYVQGTDVSQMIRSSGKLPPEHAYAIVAHVCEALAYAHGNGIIHRDIKPANVMVDTQGRVKIADFGLAKLITEDTGYTQSNMAVGTPDFVAPEALIPGVPLDGRADLYAVGVMLYQMLTGSIPRGAFKPASVIVPGLDARFDQIVFKAMQVDREERHSSALELRQHLDTLLIPAVSAPDLQRYSSAGMPKKPPAQPQQSAQKPVGKAPQRSADAPVRQPAAIKAGEGTRAPAKSKTPLFIGLGIAAAAAIGAFVMLGGGKTAKPSGPLSPLSGTSADKASKPAQGTERTTLPAPAKSAVPPKSEPKPVAIATLPKVEPPKPPAAMPATVVSTSPAPSVSKSPPLPVSASSDQKFPPGQWVKLFSKFEDLPPLSREGIDPGSWDGWINHSNPIKLPEVLKKNYGLRATFRAGAEKGNGPNYLILRVPSSISLLSSGNTISSQQTRPTGITTVSWVQGIAPIRPIKPGTEYTLEFAAVGAMAIARLNNNVLRTAKDISSSEGMGSIVAHEPVRDIEVINLDGLSEAEALKILGVDEKGNDTRAAALAAEKLAMEQKQVAQAAASIPELATLDEQLKKLTAERVSAPFEAEVAKLNSGYLGGLDRKRAEEKAAGHLDSVLAIEAEKTLIPIVSRLGETAGGDSQSRPTTAMPIPSAEDDATSTTTPAVLKGLRQIYREAYAKLEATRAFNLKALTDPLTTRLKLLESDLTKKDRIADAKTVKEYREALIVGRLGETVGGDSQSRPTTSASPTADSPSRPTTASATALKDGFTNSLGMKFVPVKGTDVLFCIHETRYKDYAAYAAEVQGVDGSWKDQRADGFSPTENKDDLPVMNVNCEDSQAFCAWLSKKEGRVYRLPTDREWSFAVGIGHEEKWKKDTTPATVNRVADVFPWGDKWPPPAGAGNFSDESRKEKAPGGAAKYLDGYDDGFPATAPVMSFKPNKLGLYDMGGNVMEWVEDYWTAERQERALRGGSFINWDRASLNSSGRDHRTGRVFIFGFRVVVETRSSSPATTKPATPTPPPAPAPAPATAAAAKSDFSNSLGMKFVKVPGTQVLFCIHETRRQDYAAYAAAVPGVDEQWKTQVWEGVPVGHEDNHPVCGVSWDDGQAFCVWLSKKERRTYRLPTDEEWSYAVGIGRAEKRTKSTTVESLGQGLPDEFPWGGSYPPTTNDPTGNYADLTVSDKWPGNPFMKDYRDGFLMTAPVMSFKPNKLGLYDLSGNVWEWVEDWYNDTQKERVLRGAGHTSPGRGFLLSTNRRHLPPDNISHSQGFRIVVEMTAP